MCVGPRGPAGRAARRIELVSVRRSRLEVSLRPWLLLLVWPAFYRMVAVRVAADVVRPHHHRVRSHK
eukprot:838787-Pyramimonas_sp.AAC.1